MPTHDIIDNRNEKLTDHIRFRARQKDFYSRLSESPDEDFRMSDE